MSDDDRMDRAERIREMRTGNRDDNDSADDGTDETAPTTDDQSGEADTTGETASEEPADDDTGTDPSVADTGADAEPAATTEETPDTGGASTDDPDPEAVAKRAAAAAAEVTGDAAAGDVATTQAEDVSATASPMQGPTGVDLPDQQLLEEAMAGADTDHATGGARAAAMGEESSQSEELVRALEFALGEEFYCLDIEYVEEIVKRDTVTRVPNTPDYVEGVVDLRGQITTILEPKEMMDVEEEGSQDLIVVFDPETFEEQGAIGWVVDTVRQVVPIAESEVDDPPVDAEYIRGVVDREDSEQFVIWVEPDDALAAATGDD